MEQIKEYLWQFKDLITSKWIIIAFLTSLTKGVFQIRKRDFSITIFITDLFLSLPVWYVWWEMGIETKVNYWFLVFTTVIMSGNAFIVLLLIFNPENAKKLLWKFFIIIEKSNNNNK